MVDLAQLGIVITTDVGSSEAQLSSLASTADTTAASLAGVEAAAGTTGAGLSKITPATAQAAASIANVGTATGAAEAGFSRLDTATASFNGSIVAVGPASATAAASLSEVGAATKIAAAGLDAADASAYAFTDCLKGVTTATAATAESAAALGVSMSSLKATLVPTSSDLTSLSASAGTGATAIEGLGASAATAAPALAALAPAMREVEVATAAVSRESVVLPLHLAHLGESAAAGTVSLRTLGSVLSGFREALGGVAAAIGISVTALVGFGIAIGIATFEILKITKETQDLDAAVENMAKGVAANMGYTAESFHKATEEAAKFSKISIGDAEELGKAYEKTGLVAASSLADLIKATKTYADKTGTDFKTAGETFTKALTDPEKAATTLDSSLVKLGDAQIAQIAHLKNLDEVEKESDVVMGAIIGQTKNQTTATGALSGTMNTVGQAIKLAAAQLLHLGTSATATGEANSKLRKDTKGATEAVDEEDDALTKTTATAKTASTALTDLAAMQEKAATGGKSHAEAIRALIAQYAPEEAKIDAINGAMTLLDSAEAKAAFDTITLTNAQMGLHAELDKTTQALHGQVTAYEKMLEVQKQESDAMNATAAKANEDTKAVKDAAKAAQDNAAAQDQMAKSTDTATTSLNNEASAASSDASALNSASGAASGAGGGDGGSSNNSAAWAQYTEQLLIKKFAHIQAALDNIVGLKGSIADIQGKFGALQSPTAPAPPKESAGATVASQPGAFGGDKNASFFFDPASRQTFLSQFGIKGDAATKNAERSYQLQLQQYNLQLQQYNGQKALLQQQLSVQQAQLAALFNTDYYAGEGKLVDAIKRAGGDPTKLTPFPGGHFASGGDFMVRGSPGQDTNLISMAMTAGELVSITPAGESRRTSQDARPINVHMTINTPDVNRSSKAGQLWSTVSPQWSRPQRETAAEPAPVQWWPRGLRRCQKVQISMRKFAHHRKPMQHAPALTKKRCWRLRDERQCVIQ